MVAINVQAKRFFLDTKLVEGLIGKKSAKSLRIALSRVRLRAMHSMKKKGAARRPPKNQGGKAFLRWQQEVMNAPSSPPGTPPYVHSGNEITSLRNIWFALDNSSSTDIRGIVGPLKLNKRGNVPRLHERGGSQAIREKRVGKMWMPAGRRVGARQPTRTRQATYPPRPFMQPALTKEGPRIPRIWGGTKA